MIQNEIVVHIGEVKIARDGEILKTILGSCVGLGFIWKNKKICGLAHCLLAESPNKTFNITGRFVDQAIPSLMKLMKIKTNDIPEIEVIVVGGGNMTMPDAKDTEKLVGSCNFRVAERELRRLGLKVVCTDHAKEEGRRVVIHSIDGSYVIDPIPHTRDKEA